MGETRQKKPSKRSVKPSRGKDNAKALLLLPDNGQIQSEARPILSDQFSELSIFETHTRGDQIPGFGPADPTLIDIRKTIGKGIGVFAARKIPAGTLVVAEAPLIRLTRAQELSTDGDDEQLKEISIKRQYTALPATLRRDYDKLFDTEKPQFSRPKSIFYSNCYNLDQHSELGGACIGLTASRINHSCSSHNVQFSFADEGYLDTPVDEEYTDESESAQSAASVVIRRRSGLMLMHAIKDIPKGKELLSNYLSPYLVSQVRQNELQMHYKFTCDCSACTQQGFWADSDVRRSQMRKHRASIERSEGVIQAHFKTSHASGKQLSKLLVLQETASAVDALEKLANLLFKEGLNGYDLLLVYQDLAKWSFMNGDATAGRCWSEKERTMSLICFGATSKRVSDIDARMEDWWKLGE